MSSAYRQKDIIFLYVVTLIFHKNFSAILFEHAIGIRRMRILAGDAEILYGTEKGGVGFLIKILSHSSLWLSTCSTTCTRPMKMAKQKDRLEEAKQQLKRSLESPVWRCQEPLRPGFTLPGVVCGVLVAKRIKNVGSVFLPDLILAPAFALLFEVDVSSTKVNADENRPAT